MKVIKIVLEALTCSFRYPHFHVGNQPTYRMPPPATIYGHICGACGRWIDKSQISFSYNFYFSDIGRDYEHIYQFSPGSGKLLKKWGNIENIHGNLVPVWRDFIFSPKLDLYISSPDKLFELYECFRSPEYPVILGRSQDLASYRKVEVIELEIANSGYLENTLLPWNFRLRTKLGNSVIMPKFIDPYNRNDVVWAPYILLQNRLFLLAEKEYSLEEQTVNKIKIEERDLPLWVDPDTPEIGGKKRIVLWHTFLEEIYESGNQIRENTG